MAAGRVWRINRLLSNAVQFHPKLDDSTRRDGKSFLGVAEIGFLAMLRLVAVSFLAVALAGCSTVPQPGATLAMRPSEAADVQKAAGDGAERNRLIGMLNSIKLSHYNEAVKEIAGH